MVLDDLRALALRDVAPPPLLALRGARVALRGRLAPRPVLGVALDLQGAVVQDDVARRRVAADADADLDRRRDGPRVLAQRVVAVHLLELVEGVRRRGLGRGVARRQAALEAVDLGLHRRALGLSRAEAPHRPVVRQTRDGPRALRLAVEGALAVRRPVLEAPRLPGRQEGRLLLPLVDARRARRLELAPELLDGGLLLSQSCVLHLLRLVLEAPQVALHEHVVGVVGPQPHGRLEEPRARAVELRLARPRRQVRQGLDAVARRVEAHGRRELDELVEGDLELVEHHRRGARRRAHDAVRDVRVELHAELAERRLQEAEILDLAVRRVAPPQLVVLRQLVVPVEERAEHEAAAQLAGERRLRERRVELELLVDPADEDGRHGRTPPRRATAHGD